MQGLWIINKPHGLAAASEASNEWLEKQAQGKTVLMTAADIRNPGLHGKYFAMMDRAFGYWSEHTPPKRYKGLTIRPDKNHFRKEVTILAGFYVAYYSIDGRVRLEAESVSWSNMGDDRFSKLYDATIDTLIQQVFTSERFPKMPPSLLDAIQNDIASFAG